MVNEAKANEEADREVERKVAARTNFQNYIYKVKKQALESKEKLSEEERADLKKVLEREIKWFEDSSEMATRKEIETHLKGLENAVNPILSKIYGDQSAQAGSSDLDDLDDL